jgi:hypothetical protein
LPSSDPAQLPIQARLLKEFVGYWLDSRRAGAAVARRDDFDIFHIPALVPRLFLYDFDPAQRSFLLRVAGEEIRRLLPNSLPGATLEKIMPPAALPVVQQRYRRVCEEPAIMHAIGRVFVNLGGTGIGERIVLPLAGADGKVHQLLGATVYALGEQTEQDRVFEREEVALTFMPLTAK